MKLFVTKLYYFHVLEFTPFAIELAIIYKSVLCFCEQTEPASEVPGNKGKIRADQFYYVCQRGLASI